MPRQDGERPLLPSFQQLETGVSTRTSAVNAPMRVDSDTFKCVNTHVVMKNEVTHASW